MFEIKKAAMFGLDARIALAIFGALSVISGAALYSAIHKSKTTVVISELKELTKAFEDYYLNNGITPYFYTSNKKFKIEDLLENPTTEGWTSPSNWNGPYVSFERFTPTSRSSFKSSIINDAFIGLKLCDDTGSYCDAGEPCYVCSSITMPVTADENPDSLYDNMLSELGSDRLKRSRSGSVGAYSHTYTIREFPFRNPQ